MAPKRKPVAERKPGANAAVRLTSTTAKPHLARASTSPRPGKTAKGASQGRASESCASVESDAESSEAESISGDSETESDASEGSVGSETESDASEASASAHESDSDEGSATESEGSDGSETESDGGVRTGSESDGVAGKRGPGKKVAPKIKSNASIAAVGPGGPPKTAKRGTLSFADVLGKKRKAPVRGESREIENKAPMTAAAVGIEEVASGDRWFYGGGAGSGSALLRAIEAHRKDDWQLAASAAVRALSERKPRTNASTAVPRPPAVSGSASPAIPPAPTNAIQSIARSCESSGASNPSTPSVAAGVSEHAKGLPLGALFSAVSPAVSSACDAPAGWSVAATVPCVAGRPVSACAGGATTGGLACDPEALALEGALTEVGARGFQLAQCAKSELLLTALTRSGASPAAALLRALSWPVYLNREFLVRGLWCALHRTGANYGHFRDLVRHLAADRGCAAAFGAKHVLIRLLANYLKEHSTDHDSTVIFAIERLDAPSVLQLLRSVQDLEDLVALGFRPTIGNLMEFAHCPQTAAASTALSRTVFRLAPVVFADLAQALPAWHDSRYNPNSAAATPLDNEQFWLAVPAYWLDADDMLKKHAPSISANPCVKKLGLLPPGNLQRMLALVHKAPTLMRYAWAKRSLTWLEYIRLYKEDYFHALVQVFLQAPLLHAPCGCFLHRAHVLNGSVRKSRYRRNLSDDRSRIRASAAPQSHSCHSTPPPPNPLCKPPTHKPAPTTAPTAAQSAQTGPLGSSAAAGPIAGGGTAGEAFASAGLRVAVSGAPGAATAAGAVGAAGVAAAGGAALAGVGPGEACMPWYRAQPSSNADDALDMIPSVLASRKLTKSPFSLNNMGRTVAIAHFLIVLVAQGVTATSIMVIAPIACHWPRLPPTKGLRALLGPMHDLALVLLTTRPHRKKPKASAPAPPQPPQTGQPQQTGLSLFTAGPSRAPDSGASAIATRGCPEDPAPAAQSVARFAPAPAAQSVARFAPSAAASGPASVAASLGAVPGPASSATGAEAPAAVEDHWLRRSPDDAVLAGELKCLHFELASATAGAKSDPLSPLAKSLLDIYTAVHALFFA